jgi:BCD family chlorophyll transporter-like MFS transporter
MCTMLLLGVGLSSIVYGALLADFSQLRLIKVIQGTAAVTMLLNLAALWKQEPRNSARTSPERELPTFQDSWRQFRVDAYSVRRLVALGIGTIAFGMQDILLEPYGGEVLKLPVSATTMLTAVLATTGLTGFVMAARAILQNGDPYRIASWGALSGLLGITAVLFSAPMQTKLLFVCGVGFIGFGGGLFAHATLTAAMRLAPPGQIGLAIGAWGSVQATASGLAIAVAGLIRDSVNHAAITGRLGEALNSAATGYGFVYTLEILLLFATLVAIGPLVSRVRLEKKVLTKDPQAMELLFRSLSH